MAEESEEPFPGVEVQSINLSSETVFDLLADSRRQHLFDVLTEHGPSLALADAADEVAAREYDQPLPDIHDEDVLAVYNSLYHHHVPKLVEYHVVEYDQERDVVAATETGERIAKIHSTLSDRLEDQ